MMSGDLKDRNAQLFVSLVIGLVQAAWVQLGKIKNELTGQVDPNLEAAKITIDTLAALELKTRGNLSAEEAEVLKRALTDLRMNYVDEVKKAAAGAGAAAPAVEAPAPPAGPAAESAGDAATPASEAVVEPGTTGS